jgi:hypothetical protein
VARPVSSVTKMRKSRRPSIFVVVLATIGALLFVTVAVAPIGWFAIRKQCEIDGGFRQYESTSASGYYYAMHPDTYGCSTCFTDVANHFVRYASYETLEPVSKQFGAPHKPHYYRATLGHKDTDSCANVGQQNDLRPGECIIVTEFAERPRSEPQFSWRVAERVPGPYSTWFWFLEYRLDSPDSGNPIATYRHYAYTTPMQRLLDDRYGTYVCPKSTMSSGEFFKKTFH